MGRPYLRDALRSLVAQDHARIEVLVVDATGGNHPPLPDLPWRSGHSVRLLGSGQRLPRPHAANVGLLGATGEWICFLDDDDFYDADFVSSMLRFAGQQPDRLLFYGSSRMLAPDGSVIRTFGVPFNRALMFCGPLFYWPAALINRRVVALGCRFDERLSVCEDRDFLAQIAEHDDFIMVPVTAFNYRSAIGTSGTAVGDNRHPERHIPYEALLRAKWAGSGLYHTLRAAMGSRAAVAAYLRGDRDAARATFEAVLREYPDDPNALHGLGRLDFEAGELPSARKRIERAVDIMPDAGEFHLTLAQTLAAIGEVAAARVAASRATRDARVRDDALAWLSRLPAESPPPRPASLARQPGRLAPCACGSGRRYKDCHGLLGGIKTTTSVAPATPTAQVDALQRANVAQRAGESTRALALLAGIVVEELSDAVQAGAAGALALAVGDLAQAERFLIRALQRDPDSPAGALLHQCAERRHAPIFAASVYREVGRIRERLMPDEVATTAGDAAVVHIVADLAQVGGSERHAINLQRILAPHLPVRLWSTTPIHPDWRESGATVIDAESHRFPADGTIVLIGQFVALGEWLQHTRCHRLVIRNNIDQPQAVLERLTEIERCGRRLRVDFSYPSAQFRARVGLSGGVELPMPDLARFRPSEPHRSRAGTAFTVGRHCRDDPLKHHPNDPAFFREVARAGHRVRLMGASVIASALQHGERGDGRERIEVIAAGSESAVDFLASLDCFVYRAHPYWYETGGNVIAEAMAMAIPVVIIGEIMGFAEVVEHGVNGFCVATEGDALATLARLAEDGMLRARIGLQARACVERLAAEQAKAIVAFYADRIDVSAAELLPPV